MPQWDTKSWSYCREFFGVFSIGIARRGIQGQIMKCTNQSQKINYLSVKPLTYPVKRKRIRGWQLYSCRVPEVLCAELRRYTESCVQDLGLFCFVSPVGWADTRGSGGGEGETHIQSVVFANLLFSKEMTVVQCKGKWKSISLFQYKLSSPHKCLAVKVWN